MPDDGNPGVAASPAAATPPPAAAPVSSSAVVPPPPPARVPMPDLSPTMPISLELTDGTMHSTTLGEMAEAYRERVVAGDFGPIPKAVAAAVPPSGTGDAQQFALFQKVARKEPGWEDAARDLMILANGRSEPSTGTAPGNTQDQMRKDFEDMQKRMATLAQTVDQWETARSISQMKQMLDSQKSKYPYLCGHPEGARSALMAFRHLTTMAEQNGHQVARDTTKLQRVLENALGMVEAGFRKNAETFSRIQISPSSPATAEPASPVLLDDQDHSSLGQAPVGAVGVLNGHWVDNRGRPIMVARTPVNMPVPGGRPDASTVITPPSGQPQPLGDKVFTLEDLRSGIKQRAASLGANQ